MRRIMVVLSMVVLLVVSAVPAMALDGIDFGDGISGGIFGPGGGIIVGDGDRDFDGIRFFEEPFEVGPAAPPSQEFSIRRITSGRAAPSFTVTNSGDNSNLCPTGQQIVNTGNVANEQGVIPSGSRTDDIDFTGSNITVDGSASGTCTQTIEQSAASG